MDKIIFLDTETTGNDPLNDRLFEVCYQIKDEILSEQFKPSIPVSVKSQSITHITNEMLDNKKPFSESQMKKDLSALLKDHILVAHNAVFDVAMLSHEGVKTEKFICTLKLSRWLDANTEIPEYNLQFLRYYLKLNIPHAKAHDAKSDVMVLSALFKRIYEKMQSTYKTEEKIIEEMLEVTRKPFLYRKFTFGKHRGKSIEDVSVIDRGYLEWLLTQKQNSPSGEEDWIHTLNYYLKITGSN